MNKEMQKFVNTTLHLSVIWYCILEWHVHAGYPNRGDLPSFGEVKKAFKLSKFIFESSDNVRIGKKVGGYTITHSKSAVYQQDDHSLRYVVAVHKSEPWTMIAFRSTDKREKLIEENINIFNTDKINPVNIFFGDQEVSVLSYFINTLNLLYDDLKKHVKDRGRRYIITGYSLGGGLASLFSLKMMLDKDGKHIWDHPGSVLITFGQPRVGDSRYAKLHDDKVHEWRKFRFVAVTDPITDKPNRNGNQFQHHSRAIVMSTKVDKGQYGNHIHGLFRRRKKRSIYNPPHLYNDLHPVHINKSVTWNDIQSLHNSVSVIGNGQYPVYTDGLANKNDLRTVYSNKSVTRKNNDGHNTIASNSTMNKWNRLTNIESSHKETSSKRSVISGATYWHVCWKMDDLRCSKDDVYLASMSDHSLQEYESRTQNKPDEFLSALKNVIGSFKNAMLTTCDEEM